MKIENCHPKIEDGIDLRILPLLLIASPENYGGRNLKSLTTYIKIIYFLHVMECCGMFYLQLKFSGKKDE